MTPSEGPAAADRLRLDLWIWRARFAPNRPFAQALIEAGRVRVNRDKVKAPGRRVTVGDVLTLSARGGSVRVVKILALPERRGSATVARTLYEDLSPEPDGSGEQGSTF
ncbi:ribosome-associated heat shock protein Hsp15 [Amorphus suaedae]